MLQALARVTPTLFSPSGSTVATPSSAVTVASSDGAVSSSSASCLTSSFSSCTPPTVTAPTAPQSLSAAAPVWMPSRALSASNSRVDRNERAPETTAELEEHKTELVEELQPSEVTVGQHGSKAGGQLPHGSI